MTGTADVSEDKASELMRTIAEMAPRKRHRLSADMVNGTRKLTEAAALMVIANLEKCQDRLLITDVKRAESPAAPREETPFPPPLAEFKGVIPAGFYATPRADGDVVDFWKVTVGNKGKWAGYSFARRVLGGGSGGEKRIVELQNMQQRIALLAIRDYGVDRSGMLFAAAMDCCRDCGRDLTDEVSRAAGRGRTCREKMG
ncbi:MAG: hypothetical protein JWM19_938 [Actinomycetia bacterium]|nr:hypothetical protein [Actinomycetes bacterium]